MMDVLVVSPSTIFIGYCATRNTKVLGLNPVMPTTNL